MRVFDNLKIAINYPSKGKVVLVMWLFMPFILAVSRFVFNSFGLSEGFTRDIFLTCISMLPMFFFFNKIKSFNHANYIKFFVLLFVVLSGLILTVLLQPDMKDFFIRSNYGLERVLRPDCAIYAFLFFSLVDNPEDVLESIKAYAAVDLVFLVLVELLPAINRGYWLDVGPYGEEIELPYSLSFGYSMLFPTITFIYFAITGKSFKYALLSILGLVCIFTQGNRGAILMIIIFLGLMYIRNIKDSKNELRKILKGAILILLILIFICFNESILESVINLLESFGVTSRNFEMISSGTFTNDNGRMIIWGTVFNAILDNPIFGYGIYGDRPFVLPFHYVGYSHNIFLELLISFGLIGVICSYMLIKFAYKMILFCKSKEWRDIFIILFSVSCQLLISMSFWYVFEFWAALAIVYKCKRLNYI